MRPHSGSALDASMPRAAADFNHPLVVTAGSAEGHAGPASLSLFALDGDSAIHLDTVKKAEDSDDLILRLFEAHGGRAQATLSSAVGFRSAERTNFLEDSIGDNSGLEVVAGGSGTTLKLDLRAFEVMTIRLSQRAAANLGGGGGSRL